MKEKAQQLQNVVDDDDDAWLFAVHRMVVVRYCYFNAALSNHIVIRIFDFFRQHSVTNVYIFPAIRQTRVSRLMHMRMWTTVVNGLPFYL